jgi:hypothetical protein
MGRERSSQIRSPRSVLVDKEAMSLKAEGARLNCVRQLMDHVCLSLKIVLLRFFDLRDERLGKGSKRE